MTKTSISVRGSGRVSRRDTDRSQLHLLSVCPVFAFATFIIEIISNIKFLKNVALLSPSILSLGWCLFLPAPSLQLAPRDSLSAVPTTRTRVCCSRM